jgi:hypothetical protein
VVRERLTLRLTIGATDRSASCSRREFIADVGGTDLARPLAARAQQTRTRPIIVFVHAVIASAEMTRPNPISPHARAGTGVIGSQGARPLTVTYSKEIDNGGEHSGRHIG